MRVGVHEKISKDLIIVINLVDNNFNARYNSKMRHYRYVIVNRKSPLTLDKFRAWQVSKSLNIQDMILASKFLIGKHDFSSFRDAECQANSAITTVNNINLNYNENKIVIEFSAKSFLHHMVRNIVGTLVYVGEGKFNPMQINEILLAKDRTKSGPNAPACGLYFLKTDYDL